MGSECWLLLNELQKDFLCMLSQRCIFGQSLFKVNFLWHVVVTRPFSWNGDMAGIPETGHQSTVASTWCCISRRYGFKIVVGLHEGLRNSRSVIYSIGDAVYLCYHYFCVVRKYRKVSQDANLAEKISRLSLHSVRKKSARISLRLGHVTGFNQPETVDKTFNALEQR